MIVVDLFLSRMKIELKTSNILLPYHTSFFSSQIRFLSWNLVIPIPTETEYVEVEGESKPSRDNDEAKWIKLSVVQV